MRKFRKLEARNCLGRNRSLGAEKLAIINNRTRVPGEPARESERERERARESERERERERVRESKRE